MRRYMATIAVLAQAMIMTSCASAWQSTAYSDDLYAVHNKIAIAERQKAEAELAKAQYEAQQAQYEATLAKIKAEAAKKGVTVSDDSAFNGYNAVLADSYESAYTRRLYGFSSPTYRMPSSYYSLRYSDAFHYASAYDPAFYNIMISGDMVWVEPKYITSMFGSWGAMAVPTYGWYYGWSDPFYYWNRPYYYDWRWNSYYGWNYPYYWGWGYPYPHYPHRPPYHRPPHHRPPYVGSGSVGSTGIHHNRPGQIVGRNPGASKPADRGGNVRPSQPAKPATGRGTQPAYRGGSSSSNQYNSGSSSYRGTNNSSNNSSSYGRTYKSTPNNSSLGGGVSYNRGSSYGGGGNSRGR